MDMLRFSVGFTTVYNVYIEAPDTDEGRQSVYERIENEIERLGIDGAMISLEAEECGGIKEDLLIQFEETLK